MTNAFSQKLNNLKVVLAGPCTWYNFVRIHPSLRVTLAMAGGVTDRVWAIELVGANPCLFSQLPVKFRNREGA